MGGLSETEKKERDETESEGKIMGYIWPFLFLHICHLFFISRFLGGKYWMGEIKVGPNITQISFYSFTPFPSGYLWGFGAAVREKEPAPRKTPGKDIPREGKGEGKKE